MRGGGSKGEKEREREMYEKKESESGQEREEWQGVKCICIVMEISTREGRKNGKGLKREKFRGVKNTERERNLFFLSSLPQA